MIDEADFILLNHALLVDHEQVIALSATSFTKDYVDETKYIMSLNFKCIDSKISGTINWRTATTDTTIEQFINKSKNMAKMIYNTDTSYVCSYSTVKDCEDLAKLKQLTKDDVLLITKKELARGIDYRAATQCEGISLFVMSKCENQRAYV